MSFIPCFGFSLKSIFFFVARCFSFSAIRTEGSVHHHKLLSHSKNPHQPSTCFFDLRNVVVTCPTWRLLEPVVSFLLFFSWISHKRKHSIFLFFTVYILLCVSFAFGSHNFTQMEGNDLLDFVRFYFVSSSFFLTTWQIYTCVLLLLLFAVLSIPGLDQHWWISPDFDDNWRREFLTRGGADKIPRQINTLSCFRFIMIRIRPTLMNFRLRWQLKMWVFHQGRTC